MKFYDENSFQHVLNLCLFYIMMVYCFLVNFYILKTNSEWTISCIAFTTALHEHSKCLKQHASFTHSHKYFFLSKSFLSNIHTHLQFDDRTSSDSVQDLAQGYFGMQTGAAMNWTTHRPISRWLLHCLSHSHHVIRYLFQDFHFLSLLRVASTSSTQSSPPWKV